MMLQSRIKDLSDIHDLLPATDTLLKPRLEDTSNIKRKNQKRMKERRKKN
jgi:hypothetical protein